MTDQYLKDRYKHEESEQYSFGGLGRHPQSHRETNLLHMLRGLSATCNSA